MYSAISQTSHDKQHLRLHWERTLLLHTVGSCYSITAITTRLILKITFCLFVYVYDAKVMKSIRFLYAN